MVTSFFPSQHIKAPLDSPWLTQGYDLVSLAGFAEVALDEDTGNQRAGVNSTASALARAPPLPGPPVLNRLMGTSPSE